MSNSNLNTFSLEDQGKAYAALMGVFSEVPAGRRLELLKAVAGNLGHRVLPGLGLVQPIQASMRVTRRMPKAPAQPKSHKSAKQRETESKIKVCNTKISDESSKSGAKLPDEHPLIIERQQLFRSLREDKAADSSPQSGESCPNV
jgi:hypothetical protein